MEGWQTRKAHCSEVMAGELLIFKHTFNEIPATRGQEKEGKLRGKKTAMMKTKSMKSRC
jgi:hypothetical protein